MRNLVVLFVIFFCKSHFLFAASFQDVELWLKSEVKLDPPASGTTITSGDLDRLVPWIPPGVIHEFDFPELASSGKSPQTLIILRIRGLSNTREGNLEKSAQHSS